MTSVATNRQCSFTRASNAAAVTVTPSHVNSKTHPEVSSNQSRMSLNYSKQSQQQLMPTTFAPSKFVSPPSGANNGVIKGQSLSATSSSLSNVQSSNVKPRSVHSAVATSFSAVKSVSTCGPISPLLNFSSPLARVTQSHSPLLVVPRPVLCKSPSVREIPTMLDVSQASKPKCVDNTNLLSALRLATHQETRQSPSILPLDFHLSRSAPIVTAVPNHSGRPQPCISPNTRDQVSLLSSVGQTSMPVVSFPLGNSPLSKETEILSRQVLASGTAIRPPLDCQTQLFKQNSAHPHAILKSSPAQMLSPVNTRSFTSPMPNCPSPIMSSPTVISALSPSGPTLPAATTCTSSLGSSIPSPAATPSMLTQFQSPLQQQALVSLSSHGLAPNTLADATLSPLFSFANDTSGQ